MPNALRTLRVTPLTEDLPYGAIVEGLALHHLDDAETRKALYALWIDKGVIVFRDGDSTPEMHLELSRCFGTPQRHPMPAAWVDGHPELTKVQFFPDNGNVYDVDDVLLGGWLPWHSDLTYVETINHGGILRPVQLPQDGGQTGFIDQITAYDRLPEHLKAKIDGLQVVYGMDLNQENQKFGRPKSVTYLRGSESFLTTSRGKFGWPLVLHPMVYTQAETGRKVLNVSPWFALGIYEMGGPSGDELLHEVVEYCIESSNAYFHEWRMGDLLLWDNWRCLHSAAGIPPDQTRIMQRTTIEGDYALGRTLGGAESALPPVDV